jgi:hypothetical protein
MDSSRCYAYFSLLCLIEARRWVGLRDGWGWGVRCLGLERFVGEFGGVLDD